MYKDFKDKVGYQIYIKSFQDSNNDGIGDIKGITNRLDVLKALGIDFIWITPFYNSPQNDNGYDVSDYKSIDPIFGDFNNFDELIHKANDLNIDIMLDMVFNHSSTEHEWFKKAINGDKKYQDYYYFVKSDEVPSNWQSKFGGSAWEYVPELDKYYLSLFDKTQADLNWYNEDVRKELYSVIKFWKDKGVKGFRFDVVNLIGKDPSKFFTDDEIGDGRRFYTDGPNVHKFLHGLNVNTNLRENLTVGEMSSTSIENCILYTNPDNEELDMVFNFHHLKVDYKDGQKWVLDNVRWDELFGLLNSWQFELQKGNGWPAWFLNNHDQPRAISRFTNDKEFHYESATVLATLTHLMRGTPYIYQGEEFGTTNAYYETIEQYNDIESHNNYKILVDSGLNNNEALHIISERSRDNGRTPVAWDNSENFGFSNTKPWINIGTVNKTLQNDLDSEKSIFRYYQELIKLRKNNMAISHGDYNLISKDNKIYIFERLYEDQKILVILNFNEEKIKLNINDEVKLKYKNKTILLNNYEDFSFVYLYPYQAVVLKNNRN